MPSIKEQVYMSILKVIAYSTLIFMIIKGVMEGLVSEDILFDTLYLVLVMFLRSSLTSPTWKVGLKWTLLLSIPLESFLYGGSFRSLLIATVSTAKFLINYGFVLDWNPVLKKKDTLLNRMIEITISSTLIAVFSPRIFQTLCCQIVFSIHMFWIQTWVVRDVCDSGVLADMKAAVAEIPPETNLANPPIELWIVAYSCACNKVNAISSDMAAAYLRPDSPWQLRRLIVMSISVDPTRTQMKSLLAVASQQSSGLSKRHPGLINSGPLALISNEPNEKIVINEAIAALSKLQNSLGEKRFASAFDKTSDAKAAADIIHQGFR
jgi:hypothetical protein